MDRDNQHFEFIQFRPSPAQVQALSKSYEEIVWLAPSDAVVKVTVKKTEALFHVTCVIRGTAGSFAAKGTSENFLPALRIMESGINREINRWKKSRKLTSAEVNEQRVS